MLVSPFIHSFPYNIECLKMDVGFEKAVIFVLFFFLSAALILLFMLIVTIEVLCK